MSDCTTTDTFRPRLTRALDEFLPVVCQRISGDDRHNELVDLIESAVVDLACHHANQWHDGPETDNIGTHFLRWSRGDPRR